MGAPSYHGPHGECHTCKRPLTRIEARDRSHKCRPEQWHVREEHVGEFAILNRNNTELAVIVDHGEGIPCEANAILMAAAPALLYALQRLAGLADGRVNGDDNDEMCAWAEALLEAQDAIKKAGAK